MNKTILILLLVFIGSQWGQAQVKRQYKDEKHVRQTVVVKTEKSISDQEILNEQFDLDEMSLGHVIRITTETDPKAKEKLKPLAKVETETKIEKSGQEAIAMVEEVKPVVEPKVEVQESLPVTNEKASRSISYNSNTNKRFYKKSKFKIRKPRFKKKKRKRVKRSRVKCYRF